MAEDDVWGWRQANPPGSDQQWDHCPGASKDPLAGIGHHSNYHQVHRPVLVLFRWAPLRCVPVAQWKHPCPKHQNHGCHQPVQVSSWWDQGDIEDNGTTACDEVPWGLGLDAAPRPVPAHLQSPSYQLPAAWVMMWTVSKGQGEGPG